LKSFLLRVLVEAFTGLSSVLALTDELGEEGTGPEEALLRVLLCPTVNDELGGVQTNIIGEFCKKQGHL